MTHIASFISHALAAVVLHTVSPAWSSGNISPRLPGRKLKQENENNGFFSDVAQNRPIMGLEKQ